MTLEGSISQYIDRLKVGDPAAAQQLWEGYFQRLVALARARLQGLPRRAADEEDVALSAFASFCRGVERGRFPQLQDRADLWKLLVTLTARKAAHLRRDEQRQKRGGGAVRGESALLRAGDAGESETGPAAGLERVLSQEPTPAFAAEVAEQCQRLLGSLGDADLQAIALGKMEGDTNEEIAARLGCALSTVERRLRLIRQIWEKEVKA
jgi:DNA-directed RNA polymerase specialized sigma24 family protein